MSQNTTNQSSMMDFSALFKPNQSMAPIIENNASSSIIPDDSNFQASSLEEANEKLREIVLEFARIKSDKSAAECEADRLRCSVSAVRQELSISNGRYESMMEEHRAQSQHWLLEKRELESRCMKLQSLETQHQASIKKKEQEFGRLQQLLQTTEVKQQPTTKRLSISAPITLTQFIPISSSSSSTSSSNLQSSIIQGAISRTAELTAELESVRSRLALSLATKDEMMTMMNARRRREAMKAESDKPNKRSRLDDDDDKSKDKTMLERLIQQHGCRMSSDWLDTNISSNPIEIRRRCVMNKMMAQEMMDDQQDKADETNLVLLRAKVERLNSKLTTAYEVIKDQDEIISDSIHADIQPQQVIQVVDDKGDEDDYGESDMMMIAQERELLNEIADGLRYEREVIQDIIKNASLGNNPILTPYQMKHNGQKTTPRTRSCLNKLPSANDGDGRQETMQSEDASEDVTNSSQQMKPRNIFD